MSQEHPTETLEKGESSLNSSSSFKMVRLPQLITSSLRLGNQSSPSLDHIEPHIVSLNEKGLQAISLEQYQQALHLFQEGQKLLEMGASCGKSIDRQLIITILTNQAYAYHQQGKLDLAKKYLEAVIYNITTYLEHPVQVNLANYLKNYVQNAKPFEEGDNFLKHHWSAIKTFINRTHQLSVYQLQFAKLLSETNQHESSGAMAEKVIRSMLNHLKYCKMYQKYSGQRSNQNNISMVNKIIEDCQQYDSASLQELERQVSSGKKGQADRSNIECDALQKKQLLRLKIDDFLMIKTQDYKDQTKTSQSKNLKELLPLLSFKNYICKALMISCAFYLISNEKAKQFSFFQNSSKETCFLGSKQQFEKIKQNQERKTKLCLLMSLKIASSYLSQDSAFYFELRQTQKERRSYVKSQESESYFVQINEVHRSQHSSKNNMKWSLGDEDSPDFQANQPGASLAPPTVQMMGLDLSCADSIDLNSNSSMIDALKNVDKDILATEENDDSEFYFQFMPKKINNSSNPLFQATTNLESLRTNLESMRNQTKNNMESTSNKSSVKLYLQQAIEENISLSKKDSLKRIEELVTKIDDQDREFLKSMIDKKEKSPSKKSKSKSKNSVLLAHSLSANSIYVSKKSKSKKKVPQLRNIQSVKVNLKSQYFTKKNSKQKNKPNPEVQPTIKLNRVKSPLIKPKVEKIEVSKDKKLRSKSKSKEKLNKIIKSKSKSTNKKRSQSKNTKSKFQPVYFQHKK